MRGCCAAHAVELLDALKRRLANESNPEVQRGLRIAIYEIKTKGVND